jgi:hypothetical protein
MTVNITRPAAADPCVQLTFTALGNVTPDTSTVYAEVLDDPNATLPHKIKLAGEAQADQTGAPPGGRNWRIDFIVPLTPGVNQTLRVTANEDPDCSADWTGAVQNDVNCVGLLQSVGYKAVSHVPHIEYPKNGHAVRTDFVAEGTVTDPSDRVTGVLLYGGPLPVAGTTLTQVGNRWKVLFTDVPPGAGRRLRISTYAHPPIPHTAEVTIDICADAVECPDEEEAEEKPAKAKAKGKKRR